MVPYFKTQWRKLLICFASLVLALISLVEGEEINCLSWSLSAAVWAAGANSSHNEDCIKALEKRVSQLENRAITDIDEISKNNFMVRRRLGPDKEGK